MQKLGLIDLSALFRKHWHASQDGNSSTAFVKTVADVSRFAGECGGRVVVCLDSPPYKRLEQYPEYKAEREAQSTALYEVRDQVLERLRSDGFVVAGADGYEADDIIATYVSEFSGREITIYSNDKDLLQLVSERVTWKSIDTYQTLDVAGVEAKTGVAPSQIPDWLALVGKKSHGVPGLPGCGPKYAAAWLDQCGDLDGICKDPAALKPEKLASKLLSESGNLMIYRDLSKLVVVDDLEVIDPAEVYVTESNDVGEADHATGGKRSLSDRMCAVMMGVRRLRKNGWNDHFKYNFATDGDVSDCIRELLAVHGVEFGVSMVAVEKSTSVVQTKYGEKSRTITTAVFEMSFRANGELRQYYWRGEAMDGEDKGINKAATAAVKYFLLKTFLISTGIPEDDADHARSSQHGGNGNGGGRGGYRGQDRGQPSGEYT